MGETEMCCLFILISVIANETFYKHSLELVSVNSLEEMRLRTKEKLKEAKLWRNIGIGGVVVIYVIDKWLCS